MLQIGAILDTLYNECLCQSVAFGINDSLIAFKGHTDLVFIFAPSDEKHCFLSDVNFLVLLCMLSFVFIIDTVGQVH